MDLYNPHSLLDEAAESLPNDELVLSKLMCAKPSCPDDMDLEKVVVTGVLFFVAFLVLSPRFLKPKRGRLGRRSESKDRIHLMPGGSPSSNKNSEEEAPPARDATTISSNASATLCTGMVLQMMEDEEETEEEKFVQMWPAIKVSPYRRLVLPPECKLVDKPLNFIKAKDEPARKEDATELDEDHPVRRLQLYMSQFLDLLRSLLSFDYINAVFTVVRWLKTCIRLRHQQHTTVEPAEEEEEEDDDDASRSTAATYSSATQRTSVPSSPYNAGEEEKKGFASLTNSPEPSAFLQEEKKDMREPFPRHQSGGSVYEVPLDDLGESDVGEPPLMPRLPTAKKSGLKRKDALEQYRGASQGAFLGQPSLNPKSTLPAPNGHVTFDAVDSAPERTVAPNSPERGRSDSEYSMSYFDAAHSRDTLKQMSVVVSVPDKNGYIVGDEFLPNSKYTPLLVFVNSRAGPQQGHLLITQLRRLLNPIQVWDLAEGGPEIILESFCSMSRLRILVCGGDGTVSWILSALEKMQLERWPPIAILPLGTGNDLARIHGWGGGYTNESLILILQQIADAYISLLDRWEMTVENKKGKVMESKTFTNYLGVGVDAQAALQVHMLRESTPKLFFSRAVNKAWYALFGAEDAIKATHANLPHEVTLIADGVEVPLPADSQGIILLNIDSYAGGIPMWSHATRPDRHREGRNYGGMLSVNREDERGHQRSLSVDSASRSKSNVFDRVDSLEDLAAMFTEEEKRADVTACDKPSSCQDGMLDIVSIRGAFHLGQIRVGLSQAQRLCQCREATVIIKRKTAVHIDGEPWRQTVATLHIKRKTEPAMMLHRSADESGGVETEMAKLLDWAEDRQIIDRNVHSILMKEFSRRIENKTRQKRVRSQDNLMLSLSRAIGRTNSFTMGNHNKSTFPNSITF